MRINRKLAVFLIAISIIGCRQNGRSESGTAPMFVKAAVAENWPVVIDVWVRSNSDQLEVFVANDSSIFYGEFEIAIEDKVYSIKMFDHEYDNLGAIYKLKGNTHTLDALMNSCQVRKFSGLIK